MLSVDAKTGQRIGDYAHIRQSVMDILTTRVGTRVARREYGALVPILIDSAMNPAGVLRLKAAIVAAITQWEPRIEVVKLDISLDEPAGAFSMNLQANYQGELVDWRDLVI